MGTLGWIVTHWRTLVKAVLGVVMAFLISWGITLHKQNKKLSESLEIALNNIEAYLGVVNDSQLANNVLKLSIDELQSYNDKILHEMDSIREEFAIKDRQLDIAATQTQTISVNDGKEVEGDLTEILKDTTYTDSIKYNALTTIRYTISKDSVNIGLTIKNTQYLFVYTTREYKNKKSFLRRLFTLDFKKVDKHKYEIVNTNDIIQTDDVRIIEIRK